MAGKEILKQNKTTETLFVGVGGIGAEIVSKIAAKCKGEELENLRFVVMDTDANSLKKLDAAQASLTKVQTSSNFTVRDYLEIDDDARLNWFPNNSTLYDKTVSEGAGQVRAISRLALNNAIRTGEFNKLYKDIDNLLQKDSEDFKQALRVVLVSSATGGTGSGMAMITAMLIREYLHDHYPEKKAIIRGFLVLPSVMDTVIESDKEKNSQYRNGYATIKEINAFMMVASGFAGTEPRLSQYKDLHIDVPTPSGNAKQLKCLPFDFCFLLEAVNRNSEGLDNLNQYIESSALCIYEQMIGPMQARAFSLEDNIIKEFGEENMLGRNRFGGIGASSVIYPYDDIVNYLAYQRALDNIGVKHSLGFDSDSDDVAGDWVAYDNQFLIEKKEYAKVRSFTKDPEPTNGSVYIKCVNSFKNQFSKDIRNNICGSAEVDIVDSFVEKKLRKYFQSVEKYVISRFEKFEGTFGSVRDLCYKTYPPKKSAAPYEDGRTIDDFYSIVQKKALHFAKETAQAIYLSAPSIKTEDCEPYHLETLLKTEDGGALHPNSVRYVLYKLIDSLKKRKKNLNDELDNINNDLKIYGDDLDESTGSKTFDVDAKFSTGIEKSFKDLTKLANQDVSTLQQRNIAYDNMWASIHSHMHTYAQSVCDFAEKTLCLAVYEFAITYVNSLSDTFQDFFADFQTKAVLLERNKNSIIESFHKDNAINNYFLCATKEKLDELYKRIPLSDHGFLLPSKLSADVFEAIKKNSELARIREYDKYAEGRYIDIFDEKLVSYFVDDIIDCGKNVLDINVVDAIFLDDELEKYIEKVKYHKDFKYDTEDVTPSQKRSMFEEILRIGAKLGAPGIGGQGFVEPRDVKICTFNESLLDIKNIDVKGYIQKAKIQAVPSDTVSKYELRFFFACYNISPDKIPLFRAPIHDKVTGEINTNVSGIYFNSYQNYGKRIGPDSMKSATISTHIDKRWDAIVELPELDFDVRYDKMMSAHTALIYGLVLSLIRKYPSSDHDPNKRVFKILNEEGGRIDLLVSNGTDCDEFYEVLDALYRDMASSNLLMEAAEEIISKDVEKNCNYKQSNFAQYIDNFRIPGSHNYPTSLFEIPLVYYNSLPSALADNNELSIMIDSVIAIIEYLVKKYEREKDRKAFLCVLLVEQYEMLVKAFKNDEYDRKFNLRKNTEVYDNIVLSMVCQKIINKFKSYDISDCATKTRALRDMIKEPEDLYE